MPSGLTLGCVPFTSEDGSMQFSIVQKYKQKIGVPGVSLLVQNFVMGRFPFPTKEGQQSRLRCGIDLEHKWVPHELAS